MFYDILRTDSLDFFFKYVSGLCTSSSSLPFHKRFVGFFACCKKEAEVAVLTLQAVKSCACKLSKFTAKVFCLTNFRQQFRLR